MKPAYLGEHFGLGAPLWPEAISENLGGTSTLQTV
jgi:hypothetical protein